jgi:hypothetical protein
MIMMFDNDDIAVNANNNNISSNDDDDNNDNAGDDDDLYNAVDLKNGKIVSASLNYSYLK